VKRGFTLVEVLVAIGVIATLIGIAVPAIGRAREHAKRAKCLSNLHQVGVALTAYASANRGYLFPPSGRSAIRWYYWVPGLNPDYGSRLFCPSAELPENPPEAAFFTPPSVIHTYLLNNYLTDLPVRAHDAKVFGVPAGEIVVMGEKRDGWGSYYMNGGLDNAVSEFTRSVDLRRHLGGSCYLFADMHVAWSPPWPARPGAADPWDVPTQPPTAGG